MIENLQNLEDIARTVLTMYDIDPVKIQVIQQGGIKTVWKVTTLNGTTCLKRLNKSMDKALFSVEAQRYIKLNGGNVAGVITNKASESITELNSELFVLYEWIEGKQLNFGNKEDFVAAMEGLADFHKSSMGYQPVKEARVSTKLTKWPEQYRSMLDRMKEWKTVSNQKTGMPFDTYLNWVDPIIELGTKALKYIEGSHYYELSNPGTTAVVLCHQDYGKGNALLTPKGVYVLDLDGVTFELAARDLRKIIHKTAENQGVWDEKTMNNILTWYEKKNKLSAEEKKMVYIDTLFPHSFFGVVKNQFSKNKPVKAINIEKIGKIEVSKENSLSRLIEGV